MFIVPEYFAGTLNVFIKKPETFSAKLSAAKAEPKNPASVMPICIVDKNLVGSSIILSIFFAFLSPSSAREWTFFSLSEITAISVAAKNALSAISTSCNSSCFNIMKLNLQNKIRI